MPRPDRVSVMSDADHWKPDTHMSIRRHGQNARFNPFPELEQKAVAATNLINAISTNGGASQNIGLSNILKQGA